MTPMTSAFVWSNANMEVRKFRARLAPIEQEISTALTCEGLRRVILRYSSGSRRGLDAPRLLFLGARLPICMGAPLFTYSMYGCRAIAADSRGSRGTWTMYGLVKVGTKLSKAIGQSDV